MSTKIVVMPLSVWLAERCTGDGRASDLDEAATRVDSIRRSMAKAVSRPVEWQDEGEVVYEREFDARSLHALRSLAAHIEYPARFLMFKLGFKLRGDARSHPGLRKIYEGADTRWPHLMRHSDNKGFWLPAPFDAPAQSCESRWWAIGSVQGLASELEALRLHVDALSDQGDRDALTRAWAELADAVHAAADASLPLILDG